MGNKWLVGLAAVVTVVAVGGVGFAQFTTSAYLNGSAAAGTLGPLTWSHLGTPVCANSYNQGTIGTSTTTNTSDTLDLSASNLAPGDWCSFAAHLDNDGSIPANVYAELVCYSGSSCSSTTLYDTFAGYSQPGETYGVSYGPITIAGHGTLDYQAEILLGGAGGPVGNGDQGLTCSFEVVFTATAGT